MTQKSSLHEKLASIRANIGTVKKTGQNRGVGGGYSFVEATQVAKDWVEAASTLNITMLPVGGRVINLYKSISEKQWVVDLEQTWRITDADTGESIEVVSYGQGADNADKALPKAQTNAMKYAILLVLQAAGDDPEADAKTDEREQRPVQRAPRPEPEVVAQRQDRGEGKPSEALLRKLMASFTDKGLKTAELRHAFTQTHTGKHSSKDLTTADVEKLLVALSDYKGLVGAGA